MRNKSTTFDLKHLSSALKPLTKKVLGKGGLFHVDLIASWKSIVGEDLGAYSMPQSIKHKAKEKNNGTLVIGVASSAFGLEVNARKSMIVQKVNGFFGYDVICDVQTIVCDIVMPKHFLEDEEECISQKESDYIKSKTKDISSESLQQVLERIGKKIIRKK